MGFTVGSSGVDFVVGFIVVGWETGVDFIVGFTVGSIGLDVVFCLDITTSSTGLIVSSITGELVLAVIVFGLIEGALVGLFVGLLVGLFVGLFAGLLVTTRRMVGATGVDFIVGFTVGSIGLDVVSCLDMTISSTGLTVSFTTGVFVLAVIVFGLIEGALVGLFVGLLVGLFVGLFVGLLVATRRRVGAGVGGAFSNSIHAPSFELKTPRQSPSLTELSNPSRNRSPVPITRYSIKCHPPTEGNEKDKGMS